MENAAEALKMAFAIFVFIMALTLVFSTVSRVVKASENVLYYSDKTNYYDWAEASNENGRIVGVDTIIATLFKQSSPLYADHSFMPYVRIDGVVYPPNANYIEWIENNLVDLTNDDTYKENILEITLDGKYKEAEDGTKVIIEPGTTRTYIIYTKQ